MTADELRKVYDEESLRLQHTPVTRTVSPHDGALLAVARHVAQAQRDSDLARSKEPAGVCVWPLVTDQQGGSDG